MNFSLIGWDDPGSEADNPENFSPEQKAKIIRYLGYANQDSTGSKGQTLQVLSDRLKQTWPTAFIAEVQTVLTALDTINEQQLSAIGKSRIIKADVITFDYGTHGKILSTQGQQYTAELANLMGVPILFNKYGGGSKISYRSY